jgi:hypothetical protein
MRMNKRDLDNAQKRYLMLELSCADRKCNPCTYPNCQRFTRENGHKRIVFSRIFEAPTRISAGGDTYRQRYVLLELSCSERKCNPCTYPNCQRYEREVVKKKPFKVKVSELSGDEELKDVLTKGALLFGRKASMPDPR